MFRKLITNALLGALLTAAAGFAKPALADSTATAVITLRCMTTLSVSLVEGNTSFILGDVAAGTTVYSNTGVTFRNDSQGAVCNWSFNVDNASLNGWTLADSPGLNQVAISGVFQKNTDYNIANFDVVKDSFSITPKDYKADQNGDGGVFACGSYTAEGNIIESSIVPYQLSDTRSDRKLWIKVRTPLAVIDQTPRNIKLVATARLEG